MTIRLFVGLGLIFYYTSDLSVSHSGIYVVRLMFKPFEWIDDKLSLKNFIIITYIVMISTLRNYWVWLFLSCLNNTLLKNTKNKDKNNYKTKNHYYTLLTTIHY